MQPRTAAEISRAELEARDAGAVVVEIYDQIYQLRGIAHLHEEREAVQLRVEKMLATIDELL